MTLIIEEIVKFDSIMLKATKFLNQWFKIRGHFTIVAQFVCQDCSDYFLPLFFLQFLVCSTKAYFSSSPLVLNFVLFY